MKKSMTELKANDLPTYVNSFKASVIFWQVLL